MTNEINMSVKYGNLSFGTIDKGFSLIDLRTTYADIDMVMDERAGYNLEIKHTNAFVSLPGISPEPETDRDKRTRTKYSLQRPLLAADLAVRDIRIDATQGRNPGCCRNSF
ncbi:MAG: hypothetical protein MZU84_02470 [Sphingobacterium sp.]|nr:hypothetical protein [Sphingobacterium sp.]